MEPFLEQPSPSLTNTVVKEKEKEGGPRICQTCPAELMPDQEPWMKQCPDCFMDDSTKRKCEVCQKPKIVINDDPWKKVCSQCFNDAALKPCLSCREPKIKAYETWRTLCKECYVAKNWKRTCEVCGERPIKDDMPSWCKTCTHCFVEKKKANFKTCPDCPPARAHLLNCRKGAPACRDCMNQKGLIVNSHHKLVSL